jgi:hypothetical protein
MVLTPNDLFSWNNKYNKYNEYNITDTFTCFFLAIHTTYFVHAGILKPWRGRFPWPLVVFSSYHVFSLPLSGLNWRSLFPLWGSGPPFPKMAPPFTGSSHTPLPGSGTVLLFHHTNIGGFLRLPLESGECITSPTPITLRAIYSSHHWRLDRAAHLTKRTQEIQIGRVKNSFWLAKKWGG